MKDNRMYNDTFVDPSQEQIDREARAERARKRLKAKKRKERAIRRSMPFYTTLCVVTIIAWLLPLRPTISEAEKRPLTKFPEFSTEALFSGDYFSGIEEWFSDTFTFRETWIDATQSFKSLYGTGTVVIHGNLPTTDDIPIVPKATEKVKDESAAAATPNPTAAPQTSTEETPADTPETGSEVSTDNDSEVTTEPTPEINTEMTEVVADEYIGNTTVLQLGDSTFCYPGFNQTGAEMYANIITKMADQLEGKANVYDVIAPENVSYMLTRAQREKYGFRIEEDAFAYIESLMGENVHFVDALSKLQEHNDEYVAFRTDHHWTARGAYYAYVAWCEEAGKEPVPLSEYEELEYPGFLGSYFYFAAKSKLLEDNPDTVYAYKPKGDVHLYLDFTNLDYMGDEYDLICDRTNSTAGSKYMAFLWADEAKATFVNNDITDGSACAIIKTSFGNPFVYYFTQHYQYVYVLDCRYYNLRKMTTFVEKFNVSDLIVIHGSAMCYDPGSMGVFSKYV